MMTRIREQLARSLALGVLIGGGGAGRDVGGEEEGGAGGGVFFYGFGGVFFE